VAAALFLSICTGIGLALLREHFIGGITRTEQFENLGGIPVVAAVPRSSGELSKRPDLSIVNQPLSAYSEAIRRALLGIIPVGAKGRRCIFVTSSVPGEGKTTLALSLARQAAITGSPTLLIDADLRHPSVRGLLGDKSEGGLIDYLAQPPGTDSHEISIVKEPSSGVSFVLGGHASSGSTDTLLMSTRFDDLIRFAREEYETIIIDTPPVGLVVDATIIARHCDAGVFVARYASTSQTMIRSSLRELMERADVPVYGILNMVARADTYGHYGKYRDYYATSS
jgi:capsular exopolysaccharide synthesis family protein